MSTALGREAADEDDQRPFNGLLNQARRGCDAALGELLECFREFLLSTAEKALDSGVRPKVGASDLVQESIIEARHAFAGFRGDNENELRAWLKRILINNLLDQYRDWKRTKKRQLSRETPLAEIDSSLHMLADPAALTPSTIVSRREQEHALQQALERLSGDHRQAIVLRHREQLTFDEIGRKMNRSAEAARMLWYRAFERLAAELRTRK